MNINFILFSFIATISFFSHNLVQFMCESLDYKNKKSKLQFYKRDNLKVLKEIHRKKNLNIFYKKNYI